VQITTNDFVFVDVQMDALMDLTIAQFHFR
jgi:hypothetical protein